MKIYTGAGDRGKTSLFSGERISKGHARIEAYGDIDELNSVLGALAAELGADAENADALTRVQSDLFHVGAWLATTADSPSAALLNPLDPASVKFMEEAIDRMEADLPPLAGFILPGGHRSAAWAHIARTVCRRAERRVVSLEGGEEEGSPLSAILVYLNRLSDYLFMLARHCNHRRGVPDAPWHR